MREHFSRELATKFMFKILDDVGVEKPIIRSTNISSSNGVRSSGYSFNSANVGDININNNNISSSSSNSDISISSSSSMWSCHNVWHYHNSIVAKVSFIIIIPYLFTFSCMFIFLSMPYCYL